MWAAGYAGANAALWPRLPCCSAHPAVLTLGTPSPSPSPTPLSPRVRYIEVGSVGPTGLSTLIPSTPASAFASIASGATSTAGVTDAAAAKAKGSAAAAVIGGGSGAVGAAEFTLADGLGQDAHRKGFAVSATKVRGRFGGAAVMGEGPCRGRGESGTGGDVLRARRGVAAPLLPSAVNNGCR